MCSYILNRLAVPAGTHGSKCNAGPGVGGVVDASSGLCSITEGQLQICNFKLSQLDSTATLMASCELNWGRVADPWFSISIYRLSTLHTMIFNRYVCI